jgi:type IV secretory pathway TraG/TraD family ATPase VirD4
MIHRFLISLDRTLPFHPSLVIVAVAILLAGVVAWLYGRSRGSILSIVAIALLALGLVAGLWGLERPTEPLQWGEIEDLSKDFIGPSTFRKWEQITVVSLVLAGTLLYIVYNTAFQEKPGEHSRRLLEQDQAQAKALGSAHLCSPRTFRRWRKPDVWGWTLRGQFWGAKGQRLGTRMSLGGEDIARGVAVFGPQGSGKTQCLILPAIADRMRAGHSLIVTDVQGELQPYIEQIASLTDHALIVHNPSLPEESCAINLCDWVEDVADARSMAAVLLSDAYGRGDPFWARAAINLLAACALHYPTFGQMLDARQNLRAMAKELVSSKVPGASDLAADFTSSMRTREPKLALNIMAEAFNVGLAPWADPAVRAITSHTDLDLADQLAREPTVLILRCSRRHTDAYGAYLGTILRVLTTRLDDIGEQQPNGLLPIPVGLVLEEFPALGRLDSLVRDINLMRKRRISVLTAAQSMAQFDHVYPARGEADRLLAGLATKIVFGGCDGRTAEFFSRLSGQQTLALASVSGGGRTAHDRATASLRSRQLLLPDDIVRPEQGHATVFAAYGQQGRAEQAIFHVELTPFFRRKDWRLNQVQPKAPHLMTKLVKAPQADRQSAVQPVPKPELVEDVAASIAQSISRQGDRVSQVREGGKES